MLDIVLLTLFAIQYYFKRVIKLDAFISKVKSLFGMLYQDLRWDSYAYTLGS